MCAVDSYFTIHPPSLEDASIVNVIPFPSKLSIDALESLGHTINFIKNWLQCFSDNYELRTFLYNENMIELFRLITLNITIESPCYYKKIPDDGQGSRGVLVSLED